MADHGSDGSLVPAGSLEVHCEVSGDGAPVVLVHGLGASTELWGELGGAFGDGWRVVRYDQRGAGRTRELEPRELSLETWADDLRALLAELGVERPVLVGHSLGASVALAYALRWPDHVEALVLMAADANLSHLAPRMQASAERIERLGLDGWVREHWVHNPPFSPASLARDPTLLPRYQAMLLRNDAGDYVRTCRAIAASPDQGGRLRDVAQPALVVVGDADDRTLPEHGRALAERMPQASVVVLADVGHTPPLEAPGEVAAAVAAFVARVRPGAGGPSQRSTA